MSDDLMKSLPEAAAYCGLTLVALKNQLRLGRGPAFVVPGLRAKFFRVADLEAWMKTWGKRQGNE